MKANCIKCSEEYNEKDKDAYYCPTCLIEKNKIAIEIDKKFANRPKTVIKTDIQILEETGSLPTGQGQGKITMAKV